MAEAQDLCANLSNLEEDVILHGDDTIYLADLVAQATLKYSIKDYDAAADLYSQATELQAALKGEMATQNAELLYAYGRCLYHVAVRKSDVLGSKVADEKQDGSKSLRNKTLVKDLANDGIDGQENEVVKDATTNNIEDEGLIKPGGETQGENKPYFQFTGDDNWDVSEEELVDYENEQDDVDTDQTDDFVNAYEVLDLARVLLLKECEQNGIINSDVGATSDEGRQVKERLADTYDLLAEISLEGERFPDAVTDLRSALKLKLTLFPKESSILAEAHYKLSLALEFSAVTQQKAADGEIGAGSEDHVDEGMREEAAKDMEAAIASCELRIKGEEVSLYNGTQTTGDSGERRVTVSDVEDVKEMVQEMKQRLVELRQPPVSFNNPNGMGILNTSHPLGGILGSTLGETPAAQEARLEEATEGAKDLTNLIKRRRPMEALILASNDTNQVDGKRKVDFNNDPKEAGSEKRARVSEGDD